MQESNLPPRSDKVRTPSGACPEAHTPKGVRRRNKLSICATPRPFQRSKEPVEPLDLPSEGGMNWSSEIEPNSRPADVLLKGLRVEIERIHKESDDLQRENMRLQHRLAFPDMPVSTEEATQKLKIPDTCNGVTYDSACVQHGSDCIGPFAPSSAYISERNRGFIEDSLLIDDKDQEDTIRRSLGRTASSDGGFDGNQPLDFGLDMVARPSMQDRHTMSLLFSKNEGNKKTREQKISKLHDWYDRLVKDDEGLTASRIQEILEHVHGPKATVLTLEEIEGVIRYLHRTNKEFQESHDETAEGGYALSDSVGLGNDYLMHFPVFADLILFDRSKAYDASDIICENSVIIRDALMRNHIDDLVVHYARLPPPRIVPLREKRVQYIIGMLDPLVGTVILLNGLTIGLSSDIDWDGWNVLELVFTVFFLTEILLKVSLTGFRNHFFGPDWSWNWFDAVVVMLAVIDVPLSLMAASDESNLSEFTVVRLARLARLTRMLRLVRILRLRIFKELLLMVKGVVAGLRTLFWAIVMLMAIVYACAILLRQTVGQDKHRMKDEYHTVLFGSVPWSMFNTFRCFTSDCTLPDGTPIAGHMYELYGYSFVLPYSLMTMFITFGIFNMVTAVFVENVMESARQRQLLSRENEQRRVAELLRNLVLRLASHRENRKLTAASKNSSWVFCDWKDWKAEASSFSVPSTWNAWIKAVRDLLTNPASRLASIIVNKEARNGWRSTICDVKIESDITREKFLEAIEDPQTSRLIDHLEVNVSDRTELFDVLDSDGSGCIDIGELISGIMKMRSSETKHDIVALILGMRGIRDTLRDTCARVSQIQQLFAGSASQQRNGHRKGSARSSPPKKANVLD